MRVYIHTQAHAYKKQQTLLTTSQQQESKT